MKKLRIDLYSGYAGDRTHTEKDVFVQDDDETPQDLIERVVERLIGNIDQFVNDDEEDEDDETDESN